MGTKPKLGDYQVTTMRSSVSVFVRLGQRILGTRSLYTHARVVTGPPSHVEAWWNGARRVLIERDYNPHRYSNFDLTDAQRAKIAAYALARVGTPYSFLDYLALATHKLGFNTRWLENYIGDTGHLICSQLVDQAYLDAGVHLFDDGRWPGYVTPADLARLLD